MSTSTVPATSTDPATSTARSTLNQIGVLILRVVLGVIFLAHGLQKYLQFTIEGTQASFADMGVPAADLVAPLVATLEAVGGAALIVGLLTRPAGILLALVSLGAIATVHLKAGFFASDGGYEYVLILAAAAFAVALTGAGRWSIDGMLGGKLRILR